MMKNDNRPRTMPAMLTALTVALAAACWRHGAGRERDRRGHPEGCRDDPSIVTNGLGTRASAFSPLAGQCRHRGKDLTCRWAFSFGGESSADSNRSR